MKRAFPILFFLLPVPLFELACLRLPIVDWFNFHVGLVIAVLTAGAAMWLLRWNRHFAYLLLSAGAIATAAGACTYFGYPFVEHRSAPTADRAEAVAAALAHALSPLFYASIAMGVGLFLGWLPAWLCARS